jgi:hypothetical protein
MRHVIGLLALTFLASSCAIAPVATQRPGAGQAARSAQHPYPVAPGTVWEYQTRQKRNDGSFSERWMKMRIASAQALGSGVTEAVLERESPNGPMPTTRIRVHPDKVVLTRLASSPDGPSLTIMKWPPTLGETWPGRPYTNGNHETISAQGWEDVTVPAGTFRAWRVDQTVTYAQGGTDTLNYWYAPGVGTVKMVERVTLWMGPEPTRLEVTANLTAVTHGAPAGPAPESTAPRERGTPGLWLLPEAAPAQRRAPRGLTVALSGPPRPACPPDGRTRNRRSTG